MPIAQRDDKPIRLIAITRKPDSASFEQRIVNYVEPLSEYGIEVTLATLPHDRAGQKRLIESTRDYDGVWWHRHLLSVFGLSKTLRAAAQKLVIDFDDPLAYTAKGGGKKSITRGVKFSAMLKKVDLAVVASQYLADLAGPHAPEVKIVPMGVDVPEQGGVNMQGDTSNDHVIELLWLGGLATQPYLELIRPALEVLPREHANVKLRLVAHEPMSFGDLPVDFRKWSHEEQAASLRECHVGLCPMPDSPWTRGKCPYKVLQYMSHGMPYVGSAVGENSIIAGNSYSAMAPGYTPETTDEWVSVLSRLIGDAGLRQSAGEAAYAYIQEFHTREQLTKQWVGIWRGLLG